jgi:type I restriction enzyme M protein
MANNNLNWIANFIWGIADDVLRDVYVRGKYRDVILPMVVIRRLDAVLEPSKQAVLAMKKNLDRAGITNQDAALRNAAGQAFYNSSPFTLRDLRSRAKAQQLKADFEALPRKKTFPKVSSKRLIWKVTGWKSGPQ